MCHCDLIIKAQGDVFGCLDLFFVIENKITLFISSLYGIEKEMYNSKHEVGKVNFSVRVPLVVDDYYFNKTSYTLNEGTVYDLANTIYKNIHLTKKFYVLVEHNL